LRFKQQSQIDGTLPVRGVGKKQLTQALYRLANPTFPLRLLGKAIQLD
jgi:hypothetical protein